MTSSFAILLGLLVAASGPSGVAPAKQERSFTLVITGPADFRVKTGEILRALIGAAPDVRWTMEESSQAAVPRSRPDVAEGIRIRIDVTDPIQLLVYLPGCSGSGARNVRTVDRPGGDDDLVAHETAAQIVKAALQRLRSDGPPTCEVGLKKEMVAVEPNLPRRRGGAIWLGMGAGAGWGYVPAGWLEWQQRIMVQAQATSAGLLHLAPEVGYMWSDDFAIAAQVRLELIQQEEATYRDPMTGEEMRVASDYAGSPKTTAFAGILRAIWYRNLSRGGRLRASLSGDLGGGVVRFPIDPIGTLVMTPEGDVVIDRTRTIPRTDTRPMGVFLFGGSAGLIWHLSRHFAVAFDVRLLSGLPDWGVVVDGQISAQVAFGGAGPGAPPSH